MDRDGAGPAVRLPLRWGEDEDSGDSRSARGGGGPFQGSPVPTLILEGEWDLTWNTDKPEILLGNHPGAELVIFQNAGHGVYDENPDSFFGVLERFMQDLPGVSASDVAAYKEYLVGWARERSTKPWP